MNDILNDLNEIDKDTDTVLLKIRDAFEKVKSRNSVINNIYTEGGSVTIERLGQSIDNKDQELVHLREMLKQMEKIIEVKNDQIQLMRDTLADNKLEIEDLRNEIKLITKKD